MIIGEQTGLTPEVTARDDGNIIFAMITAISNRTSSDWFVLALELAAIPFLFAIAAIPLTAASLAVYILVAIAAQSLFFLTAFGFCIRGRRYYLHKPNEFVDVYDDPKSQHWLGVKPSGPTAPAG
jgi:hypothetical protein